MFKMITFPFRLIAKTIFVLVKFLFQTLAFTSKRSLGIIIGAAIGIFIGKKLMEKKLRNDSK